LTADQLRIHQIMSQLRAANPGGTLPDSLLQATLMSQLNGPPPNVKTALNSNPMMMMHRAASQQQHAMFAGHQQQMAPPRQPGRPAPGTDKQQQMDAGIARWFGADMYAHRLPNMPGQKVMTLDEIECAPPTAN